MPNRIGEIVELTLHKVTYHSDPGGKTVFTAIVPNPPNRDTIYLLEHDERDRLLATPVVAQQGKFVITRSTTPRHRRNPWSWYVRSVS